MPDNPPGVEPIAAVGQRRTNTANPFPRQPSDAEDDRWEWNTDAAAAEAKRRFDVAAHGRGEQLGHREQSAVLYKSGAGVAVGALGTGAIGTGSARYDFTGIAMKDVIGIIHNHPGGTLIPSAADWNAVYDRMTLDITAAGGDGGRLLMYIIGATYPPEGPKPTWRIFVYDPRNRNETVHGPEVNPAAQPC
jgi:hypothetical protein